MIHTRRDNPTQIEFQNQYIVRESKHSTHGVSLKTNNSHFKQGSYTHNTQESKLESKGLSRHLLSTSHFTQF